MALATLSDALPQAVPHSPRPPVPDALPGTGLAARLSSLAAALAAVVADLDPGLLLGSDAAALYGDFARLERLVVAGKTLLAPRIAESNHWEAEGHRSAAGLLATLEGGSAGAARRTLETGRRLVGLPGTTDALRAGTLSGPKLSEIAQAAEADPGAEGALLAGSDAEPLHVVKERCARVRATSAAKDPLAALQAVHRRRSFTWWNDAEGAFCFQGRDTAERGAALVAHLVPVADRLRRDRRTAAGDVSGGSEAGGDIGAGHRGTTTPGTFPAPAPEPEAALRADALFLLVTGRRPTPPSSTTESLDPLESSDSNDSSDPSDSATAPSATAPSGGGLDHLAGPDDLVTAGPPATVMVRVDLEALRRGRALPGELSAIDGQGPVPVPVVRHLLDDASIALVFCQSDDISAIAHLGRTVNASLRTGLAFRDRTCVVPGCGVAYGLEIDHVVPLAEGGPTALANLALLCRHHHRLKTYDGWVLERTGPSDADPGWRFGPQPPFGQEPGLGIDRPPDPVPRR